MTLAGEAVIIWTATGLSVIAMSVAEKNGEECSTLASTYNLVYDAYGLVLISSTLCSRYVSMKEYDVEERDSRIHKRKCLFCLLPTNCNDILIGYLKEKCLCWNYYWSRRQL